MKKLSKSLLCFLILLIMISCSCFVSFAADGTKGSGGGNIVVHILIAVAIGFLVAFIVTGVMKSKLKSVRAENAAANYTREGSFNVTESKEIFLYKETKHTAKPKNNDNN